MIINTAGVGVPLEGALGFDRVGEGDAVVLSGPLGEHGLAVMCQPQGPVDIAADLVSDCAPLHELTAALMAELGGDGQVDARPHPRRAGGHAGRAVRRHAAERGNQPAADARRSHAAGRGRTAGAGPAQRRQRGQAGGRGRPPTRPTGPWPDPAPLRDRRPGRRHRRRRRRADLPLVELLTPAGGRRVVQMPYGEDLPRIC